MSMLILVVHVEDAGHLVSVHRYIYSGWPAHPCMGA